MSILDDIDKALDELEYEPDAILVTRKGGEMLQAKYGGELVEVFETKEFNKLNLQLISDGGR